MKKIVLGGGCFWCLEAVFRKIKGVEAVKSGYAGGDVENPSYREVCGGNTGHAEVVRVQYNSEVVTLDKLLMVFWNIHDPTTLNRQGNDVGTQYRSAIYYENKEDLDIIEKSVKELEESGDYDNPVVTEIEKLDTFYPAEVDHDNYYEQNPGNPYCSIVIKPKVKKLMSLDIETK